MIHLNNIVPFAKEPPEWSVFGSAHDFESLPQTHQDQIFFLNKEANDYLYEFLEYTKLLTGPIWNPFEKKNFKTIEEISLPDEEEVLKKWLYQRGIPFQNWVFLLPNHSKDPIYLTWKMVIKYSHRIFWGSDLLIFDKSANWCLFFFHEDYLFFGKENLFDPEIGYEQMRALYRKKEQFPGFNHPLLPKNKS